MSEMSGLGQDNFWGKPVWHPLKYLPNWRAFAELLGVKES